MSGLTYLQQVINGVRNTRNSSLIRLWSFGEKQIHSKVAYKQALASFGGGQWHSGKVVHVFWSNLLFLLLLFFSPTVEYTPPVFFGRFKHTLMSTQRKRRARQRRRARGRWKTHKTDIGAGLLDLPINNILHPMCQRLNSSVHVPSTLTPETSQPSVR